MSDPKARARAAIYGALVADAAANPLNWIYDGARIKSILEKHNPPEFCPEWACPFYKTDVGSFSTYGEQAFCTLKSIADNNGFDLKKYVSDQYNWFGPNSKFEPNPGSASYPKLGPWMHGCIARSLNKLKDGDVLAGSDEAEGDSFSKVIPLVALFAGKKELDAVVEKAVRTTLNNDKSVETAQAYAKLLESCILHGNYDIAKWCKTLPDGGVKDDVEAVLKLKEEDHKMAVKKMGIACALPGSFQGTIHCLLKCSSNFVDGVRLGISPGGGICGRCIGVGAVLAAKGGLDSIPNEWLNKTLAKEEMVKYADILEKL